MIYAKMTQVPNLYLLYTNLKLMIVDYFNDIFTMKMDKKRRKNICRCWLNFFFNSMNCIYLFFDCESSKKKSQSKKKL